MTQNSEQAPADPMTAKITEQIAASQKVNAHISFVQVICLIIAVLSAVLAVLQNITQTLPNLAWAPPTIAIISAVMAGLQTVVKAYNVPSIVLMFTLLIGLTGCGIFATPTPLTPQEQLISKAYDDQGLYLLAKIAWGKYAADNHPSTKVVNDVTAAFDVVKVFLDAEVTAAESGDAVTVTAKKKLFNDALAKIGDLYAPMPTTGPHP